MITTSNSVFWSCTQTSSSSLLYSNDVYINWMDCAMLKKLVPIPDSKIQLFGSFFLLWLLITIFTNSYHYLGDPFHRQLQLFCYCACPYLPKWRKIGPIFLDPLPLQQSIQFKYTSLV